MTDQLDKISSYLAHVSAVLLAITGILFCIDNEDPVSRLCGALLIVQGISNLVIDKNTISTAALGLCLLLLSRQRVMGAVVAMLCSSSLMIGVWPVAASSDNPSSQQDGLLEPLLEDTTHANVEASSGGNDQDVEAGQVPDTVESSLESDNGRLKGTRRLLELARPEVRYLYLGCLVLLVRLPFSLAMPHFVSQTLGALANADFAGARSEVMHLLMAGTIDAALDFWGFFLFGYANQRIVKTLRVDLFRKLLGFEIAYFDRVTSGELSSRINADCSEMAGDLTWFFRFSIESIVRITGIATYMLVRSPILGGCALLIVPFVAVINKLYGDWLRNNATKVQDALAEANSVAQEVLSNVRTVIAFAAEQKETEKYQSKIERQYQLNVRQLFMTAVYYMAVSTFLINTIVQGALLWIGIILIEHGKLTPGILLAFMLYQSQLQNETLSLMNSYTSLIKSSGAGTKVFQLLDRRPPPPGLGNVVTQNAPNGRRSPRGNEESAENGVVEESANVDTAPEAIEMAHEAPIHVRNQYHVLLENVFFRYPTRPDNVVLEELTLEIPQGKTVALVGKSGCGKSTIINLLQRFYDPTEGRVLIDGVDLRQLDLLDHRRHIGVVTQFPTLFAGSIWDNIAYGCDNTIQDEEVRNAARLAKADSFIEDFAEGYQTDVGEGGVQLSGGQKQRIAIARAIVLQPSLLLLDEATSALDSESEIAVQKALDDLLETNSDMTTVVIAHRLRTVQNADKIVVIEDGKVAESGTHQELLGKKQIYFEMVRQAGASGLLPES